MNPKKDDVCVALPDKFIIIVEWLFFLVAALHSDMLNQVVLILVE